MMTTSIQEQDGKFLVTLSGELDTAAARETEQALQPLLESDGKPVVIYCASLEYISSSGLRILLGILKHCKANGSGVVLKNVKDEINEVLKLTGFVSLFNFE